VFLPRHSSCACPVDNLRPSFARRTSIGSAHLSAFAGTQDRERALAAGFHHHVSKPVDPAALVALLSGMLGGHPEQRYSS
jgi:CheY-like chemotaxis protein